MLSSSRKQWHSSRAIKMLHDNSVGTTEQQQKKRHLAAYRGVVGALDSLQPCGRMWKYLRPVMGDSK